MSIAPSPFWNELLQAHSAYSVAYRRFLNDETNRVDVLRTALRGKDRPVGLVVARSLSQDEKRELFPEWVFLASWAHGAVQVARDAILSLPRPWVIERIEAEVEPYLEHGTYDEFRRFLELYDILDKNLMIKLARRAVTHEDPDIREAGEDFLAKAT